MNAENKYRYQDGEEAKEGDIVFYSEQTAENNGSHYADSICVVVKAENDLKLKAFVITMDEAKTFQEYEEPDYNTVSLFYTCDNFYSIDKSKPNVLKCVNKIGELPQDKYMLSASFAMNRYGRDGNMQNII